MPNYKKLFKKDFMRACDLDGDTPLTIAAVEMEVVGTGDDAKEKGILRFREREEKLVLNATNGDTIAELHGEDYDNWLAAQADREKKHHSKFEYSLGEFLLSDGDIRARLPEFYEQYQWETPAVDKENEHAGQ